METGDASPRSETASSAEASSPVQNASHPTSASRVAFGDVAASEASRMATEGESVLMVGETLKASVMEIVALGYTKDQASVAMAASCNDPNRAVEYLLSGGVGMASETGNERTNESRDEFNFPVIPEDAFSMADPLSSNPQMLNSLLQSVRRTNPRLHKMICENRERFLQTLNEPIADDVGLGDLEGGGGGGGAVFGSIVLSQAEHQAVERLMALRFSQSLCVQAYFACEKNENLAANFLLSQDLDEPN